MKIIEELFQKYILKPISIVFVVMISIGTIIIKLPNNGEFNAKFFLLCLFLVLVLIIYIFLVYKHNKLPRAKGTGVLFIFHAANEELYKDAQFLFVESFKDNARNFDVKLTPICINANQIKGYDISNKPLMEKTLEKTNCVFSIDICYKTDDPKTAQNYEVVINTKVLHPNISDSKDLFLINELNRVSKPVKNLRFKKDEKLLKISIASAQLLIISKYIISLAYIVIEDYKNSDIILKDLYSKISENDVWIFNSIKKAYYLSCRGLDILYQNIYNDSGKIEFIDKAEECLKIMNSLFQNTYDYNLDMARVLFIKYKKIAEAKTLINECKKSAFFDTWIYSEAFLYAYDDGDINVIINKYQRAVESSYNIIDIIKFIETAIVNEPQKVILHLPLAILYNEIGDKKLTAIHINQFIENNKLVLSNKSKGIIKSLKNENCDLCKDRLCETCKKIA